MAAILPQSLAEQTDSANNATAGNPPTTTNGSRNFKVVHEEISYTKSAKTHSPENSNFCPPAFDGLLSNPNDCRTFYNCADGNGSQLECSDHLVFNEFDGRCDYPEDAGCCEFWEVDRDKLVYDFIFT